VYSLSLVPVWSGLLLPRLACRWRFGLAQVVLEGSAAVKPGLFQSLVLRTSCHAVKQLLEEWNKCF